MILITRKFKRTSRVFFFAFMKRYIEICNEIKSMISVAGLNGKNSDDGDWDDGIIVHYSND